MNSSQNQIRHTQGPWRPEYAGYNDTDGNFGIEKATIRGAGDLVVAEVEPHHASVADVVANANLIAAAPELLKALRTAVAIQGGVVGTEQEPGWSRAARAAIAKATGAAS